MQTKKHVAFSKEWSFGRIDVFGGARIAVQDAARERDHFTHIIEDGEHQTVAKPIVKIAIAVLVFAQFYQAACQNLWPSITLPVRPLTKTTPAVRGVTQLPFFCDLTFNPALFEIVTSRRAKLPFYQIFMKPLRGIGV